MEDAAGGAAHRAADQEGSAGGGVGRSVEDDGEGSAGAAADNGGSAVDGAAHRAADQEGSAVAADVEDAAARAPYVGCATDNNREGSAGSGRRA